jgi:hypothetical protein
MRFEELFFWEGRQRKQEGRREKTRRGEGHGAERNIHTSFFRAARATARYIAALLWPALRERTSYASSSAQAQRSNAGIRGARADNDDTRRLHWAH